MSDSKENGNNEDKGVLGIKVNAPDEYAPQVLFAIARSRGRETLGLNASDPLPFEGEDLWNCYELSWLNDKGVPRRGIVELAIPCTSPNLVESKSLKLYLNSLSFMRFPNTSQVLETIKGDLEPILGDAPTVGFCHQGAPEPTLVNADDSWICIDNDDVGDLSADIFQSPGDSNHLKIPRSKSKGEPATERLVSHVLRTLCPVTGQPDWGSVLVEYSSDCCRIDRACLLKYLVSLRKEVGFHENAVERIFIALLNQNFKALRVTGRFFRRGGIDINPTRCTKNATELLGPFTRLRVWGQ